jgi:uracil phosphoribosyltransferase
MKRTQSVGHPLLRHCIDRLREETTPPEQFRQLCEKVTTLLTIAATTDLSLGAEPLRTPLEEMEGCRLAEDLALVAILRAGVGMIEGVVRLLPDIKVGYIGMERDETTAEARRYYGKLPPLEGARVLVVDPMLATGGSAEQAVAAVYEAGARRVDFLCIVAAPEGIELLESRFPELRITAGVIDRELDANKYIRPGLGDFGDRLYGT